MNRYVILTTLVLAVFICSSIAAAQSAELSQSGETITSSTTLSKEDQWHNLKRWVALTFDNSSVIDMEDPERGTMVIKWSCPIKLNTDYVTATGISTYVIDVRDGKYRLQRINPRIAFQFVRPDIYDEFDAGRAEQATSDIRLINGIATRMYGGSLDWPTDEKYDEVIDAYRQLLATVPQYRNDRDKERGKLNDEWKKAEHNWQLIRLPLNTFRQLDASMLHSLDNALKHNDDF